MLKAAVLFLVGSEGRRIYNCIPSDATYVGSPLTACIAPLSAELPPSCTHPL